MKNIKKAAIAVIGAVPLMLPLGTIVHAQQAPEVLPCFSGDAIQLEAVKDAPSTCDLSVDKQVSVDGGATFTEADSQATAAQTTVGSTVIWKITVDKSILSLNPTASYVYIKDDLPAGVSFGSAVPTAGTWGVWASDVWALPLFNEDESSNLPATLTITTTSTSTGLFDNTALLYRFEAFSCPDGGCAYVDGNSSNDSNDAWIDPSAKPVVLAESTLANTGTGTALQTAAAGFLIVSTAVALLAGRQRGYKAER